MRKRWLLRKQTFDNTFLTNLINSTKLPKELVIFLSNRTIVTKGQIDKFINPMEEQSFLAYQGGKEFIDFLLNNTNKIIGIYGDYDCDGVSASVICKLGLEKCGFKTLLHTNNRFESGYGLNRLGIDTLKSNGAEVIFCVDLGIGAVDEVEYANSLGLEVLIIDHHQPSEVLPNALSVVDPWRVDDNSKFKSYCSSALAYQMLRSLDPNEDFSSLLGFVCLATLADVMELKETNRYYVKAGLTVINQGVLPAYQVIKNSIKTVIDEEYLKFYIIPKINAVGRMLDSVKLVVDFYLSDNYSQANAVFNEISSVNKHRQDLTEKQLNEAIKLIDEKRQVQVIVGDFHEGIVGIIAGRIKNITNKTTIVLTTKEDVLSGSIRTIEGFQLQKHLTSISDCIISFGGHDLAGGINIKAEELVNFMARIEEFSEVTEQEEVLYLDYVYQANTLKSSTIEKWELLKPFGNGFEYPVFGLVISNYRYILLKDKYLKITCGELDIMAFNSLEYLPIVASRKPIKVVVKFTKDNNNRYQAILVEKEIRYLDDVV